MSGLPALLLVVIASLIPTASAQGISGQTWAMMISRFAAFVFYFIVVIWWMFHYFENVVKVRKDPPNPEDVPEEMRMQESDYCFKPGFFTCCDDGDACLMGCCCSALREGDTAEAAGIFPGFWPVFIVSEVLSTAIGISSDPFGVLFLWVAFVALRLYIRISLREKYGGYANLHPCDLAAVCCCPCCSIVQEARFIDQASHVNFQCPWKLSTADGELLVGEPVAIDVKIEDGRVSGKVSVRPSVQRPTVASEPKEENQIAIMEANRTSEKRNSDNMQANTLIGNRASVDNTPLEAPKARE